MIVVLVPVGILAVIVAYAALTAYGHRFDPQSMLRPVGRGLGRVRYGLRRAGPRMTSTASGPARAAAGAGAAPAGPERSGGKTVPSGAAERASRETVPGAGA